MVERGKNSFIKERRKYTMKELKNIKNKKLEEYSMKEMIKSLNIVNMVLYLDAYKALKEAMSISDVIYASLVLDSLKGGLF